MKGLNKAIGFIGVMILSCTFWNLQAQDEYSYNANLLNTVVNGGGNLQYITPNLEASNATDQDPFAFLKFEILTDQAPYHSFTCSFDIEVTPIGPDGLVEATTENISLTLENNRSNSAGVEQTDLITKIYEGKYGLDVKINGVTFNDLESGSTSSVVPANIKLTLGFKTQRFYELPDTVPSISTGGSSLKIWWNAITKAQYYEVEWTWLDNFGDTTNVRNADEILLSDFDFQNNSTRIQTEESEYQIPSAFSSGYVVYRVRAVGSYAGNNRNRIKKGPWSSGTNVKTTVADWPNKFLVPYNYEGAKNWQYQASYAEGGKKKEVVSYFDGSLRNRQTVTRINSDGNAVAGSVIYDAQGRPAVEVLPVPTTNNSLGYQSPPINTSGEYRNDQYSYLDFDTDAQNIPDTSSAEKQMGDTSSAAWYYSNNNSAGKYQSRLPAAQGYPFSQIEYTPDNTGRIRRKGGVGPDHQLGSGHEMEYFYGVPEQKELNRLFGYSVGNSGHYKKNMVLDPNRQLSVSYIDPQGRTIATALAGYRPPNLAGLEDEQNGEHEELSIDLLNKLSPSASDTVFDNNRLSSSGLFASLYDEYLYSGIKTVVFNGFRTFDYALNNTSPYFHYEGCITDNSYPLVYNLKLDVLNEDGLSLLSEPLDETVNLGDTGGSPFEVSDLTVPVKRGTVSLSKKVSVDYQTALSYAEDYINRLQDPTDSCYTAPGVITPPPLSFDIGCFTSCQDCSDALREGYPTDEEARQAYVQLQVNSYDPDIIEALTADEILQLEQTLADQWDSALAECNEACSDLPGTDGTIPDLLLCNLPIDQMMTDMSPQGQYGGSGGYNSQDVLNVYNTGNRLASTGLNGGSQHNSWKNPFHPDFDAGTPSDNSLYTQGHYYNTDGTISYIQIDGIQDENDQWIYTPAIDAGAPVRPGAVTGRFWVEPQYLIDVTYMLQAGIWKIAG